MINTHRFTPEHLEEALGIKPETIEALYDCAKYRCVGAGAQGRDGRTVLATWVTYCCAMQLRLRRVRRGVGLPQLLPYAGARRVGTRLAQPVGQGGTVVVVPARTKLSKHVRLNMSAVCG
jgi:hypothetical protein